MLLQVQHVEKVYGKGDNRTAALRDVSFHVGKGEFICIMGASGSGKTTLLNCISTIDHPSSGKVLLDGEDMGLITEKNIAAFRRQYLGFVFQDSNLLDTLTMEENIALPLTIHQLPADEIHKRVSDITKKLGIVEILRKFPYQVSGGQKQRCAAARAMAVHPKLILADEPTGALDSHSAQNLMELFQKMNTESQATILMVTHDPFSASYSGRVLFLKDGKLFKEIQKGWQSQSGFYHEILQVLSEIESGDFIC